MHFIVGAVGGWQYWGFHRRTDRGKENEHFITKHTIIVGSGAWVCYLGKGRRSNGVADGESVSRGSWLEGKKRGVHKGTPKQDQGL